MSLDNMKDLDTLPLSGSVVRELIFVPQRKFELNVQTAPFLDSHRGIHVSQIYEIKFARIGHLTIDIEAKIWLELTSVTVHRESDFLESYTQDKSKYRDLLRQKENMKHINLVFEEGCIDLIAGDVTVTLIDEMPAIEQV